MLAFRKNLTEELLSLKEDIEAACIHVGDYHYFTIFDPKERIICAASFKERVLHHAIINICEPLFEKALICHTYACRKGKGRLKAIYQAQNNARKKQWFLKMDIRKYFNSINHSVLKQMLESRLKDRELLGLLFKIIDSYQRQPGTGIPIGNLTSQHFANFYLNPLDRLITEKLGIGHYVRYMDDFTLWHEDKKTLNNAWLQIENFLYETLKLKLKPTPYLNRTAHGMEFLGFRVFPHTLKLNNRSKKRFINSLRELDSSLERNEITPADYQRQSSAIIAYVEKADTLEWRKQILFDNLKSVINHRKSLPLSETCRRAQTA